MTRQTGGSAIALPHSSGDLPARHT